MSHKFHTSLDSSLELYTGSEFFLLLLFVLFVSFFAGGGFLPLPLVPRRPTPLVSSSAANANKSVYCFCERKKKKHKKTLAYFRQVKFNMCGNLKIPLCYHCCLKRLVEVPVALHLVHKDRYQFRYHDDNFVENAPDDKATKNRLNSIN